MPRKRCCEVCGEAAGAASVDLGTRVIVLCAAHRQTAQLAGATSTEAVRDLFKEVGGRRALLPRRQEDRRQFPPRPEGRRHDAGRRSSDKVGTRRSRASDTEAAAPRRATPRPSRVA